MAHKRYPALLLLAALLLFLCAGCGAQEDPGLSQDPPVSPSMEDNTPSVPPEGSDDAVLVPVLMYHHFTQDPSSDMEVTPETFARHMDALAQAGYTTVQFQELIDFVCNGGSLPEKPVCVTIDDGYLSNYEFAWPILSERGMKATIFVIGSSIGHTEFYKDTEFRMTPHFGWDEAREMQDSGVMDIQCHTYDFHQWPPFETGDMVHRNILRLEGEDEETYRADVIQDLTYYNELRIQEMGTGFSVLAYPEGAYDDVTEEIVHALGFQVTLSTRTDKPNIVVRNQPESLYALCRWTVNNDVSPEQLLEIIQS